MYIKQKNADVYIVDDNQDLVIGTVEELNKNPCMSTGNFEIVENLSKHFEQLIYKENAD